MQVAKVSLDIHGFLLFFFVRSTQPPELAAVLLLTPLLDSGRVKTTMYYCLDTYSSFASSLFVPVSVERHWKFVSCSKQIHRDFFKINPVKTICFDSLQYLPSARLVEQAVTIKVRQGKV